MSLDMLWHSLKSKTINFGLLLTIFGAVQSNIDALQLDPKVHGLFTMGVGIIVVLLRYVTTKPVGDK